jgi:hypothetical protein
MRHKRGVSGTALPLHPRLVFTANQDGRLRGVQLENDVTLLPVLEKVRLDADPRVECLEVRPREVLDCDPRVGGCYHRPGRAIGLGEQGPVIDHTLLIRVRLIRGCCPVSVVVNIHDHMGTRYA